jgi:hypothetical protein
MSLFLAPPKCMLIISLLHSVHSYWRGREDAAAGQWAPIEIISNTDYVK